MSSLALLIFVLPVLAFAQGGCGDFIDTFDGVDERTPIENCEDPFGLNEADVLQDFSYFLESEVLVSGEERQVEEFPARISLDPATNLSYFNRRSYGLYRHEGNDFRLIDVNYNGVPASVTLTTYATGTYSIVTTFKWVSETAKAKQNWWQQALLKLVPIAHAQIHPDLIRGVLTFTLTEPTPLPTGASNVLFLPGIMGSRLYETSNFCNDVYSEKQLWFSTNECRQLRLTTKFTGQSLNTIYTKGSEEGIVDDAFIFFNIYDSFLEKLVNWKEEDLINEYAVLPNDWRMELDDILKSKFDPATGQILPGLETSVTDGLLYKLITYLARNSKSNKVTIVTHSNGGLIIKQLLSELQYSNDPLLEKIDTLILVAVPQQGSLGSAIGMLHGEEIDNVMSQAVTRRLMNTMPFSHHLLPTHGYFDAVTTPAVVFEAGNFTDDWVTKFGSEITTQAGLHEFISSESGRDKPSLNNLAAPETADPFLLQYAKTTEVVQTNFVPKPEMKVHQIAGTGLPTPSQLIYFTDRECISRIFFICTAYEPKLGYRVKMTIDGDVTVPVPSALAFTKTENIKRSWVNLLRYNNNETDRSHKDIFEITELSEYIEDTLKGVEGTYDYIHDVEPEFEGGERLVFQLHSPLDLSVKTVSGKVVSSSTNDINGAIYRRYGELQYIDIPRTERVEVVLKGLASGSFTLDVELWDGENELERQTYSGIPSSTSTDVRMAIDENNDLKDLVLKVDYDGDGEEDLKYDSFGVIEDGVTYKDLYQAIDELTLERGQKVVLLTLTKVAERFSQKGGAKFKKHEQQSLRVLVKQSILYERLGLISDLEQVKIETIASKLINLNN